MATGRELLLDVELPRSVWSRSGRPLRGNLIRWGIFGSFVIAGLAAPSTVMKLVMLASGVGLFFAVPSLADSRLNAIEADILGATKRNAATLLGGLEARKIVELFAPHGWVALQKARLHLLAGDGRAAARALSECGRMCNEPKNPALLSGQARAFTLSGDRVEAREVLLELSKRDVMTSRDHLDYGVLLLGESGRVKQAREEIERAATTLGEHPQARAALAVVRARDEKHEDATSLLEQAEEAPDVADDVLAQELIKKARKSLRPVLKEVGKKKGKRSESTGAPASRDAGSKKKDKRKERRERRKAGKASGKHEVVAAAPAPAAAPAAAAEPKPEPQREVLPAAEEAAAPRPSEPAKTIAAAAAAVAQPPVAQPPVAQPTVAQPTVAQPTIVPVVRAPAAPVPSVPAPPPAGPARTGTLFNQIGSRVSMFKPPPLPSATQSPTSPSPTATPVASKLAAAPTKAPAPLVAPPPKVAAKPVAPPSGPDDDWADMLDSDDPPAPLLTKK